MHPPAGNLKQQARSDAAFAQSFGNQTSSDSIKYLCAAAGLASLADYLIPSRLNLLQQQLLAKQCKAVIPNFGTIEANVMALGGNNNATQALLADFQRLEASANSLAAFIKKYSPDNISLLPAVPTTSLFPALTTSTSQLFTAASNAIQSGSFGTGAALKSDLLGTVGSGKNLISDIFGTGSAKSGQSLVSDIFGAGTAASGQGLIASKSGTGSAGSGQTVKADVFGTGSGQAQLAKLLSLVKIGSPSTTTGK
ncbi:MAG: hypothetical protein WDW38_011218 [Sanguina aurantia]